MVHGEVAPGFEPVRDAFAALGEPAAAVAAHVDGRAVVDLWSGTWERDTIAHTYSVTKPFAAMCALILVDRGRLALDEPVASYWPEFAQAGKESVTVRHVLSHQAGLVALREPQPLETLLDWDRATAALAAEEPWWEPGTAAGEHALFYGHLVGELVRRVDGRTLGAFLREEVAEPWSLDFHIGVGGRDEPRVHDLSDPGGRWAAELLADASPLFRLAVDNPPGTKDMRVVNSRPCRAAEIPAINGHGSARAVARFYEGLLGNGTPLIGEETLREAIAPQWHGIDRVLEDERSWGLGFSVDDEGFGMGGIGGSVGFADPEKRLAFGYVTATMGTHDRADAVERAVLDALG